MSFNKFSDYKDAVSDVFGQITHIEKFTDELAVLLDASIEIRDQAEHMHNPNTGNSGMWIPETEWSKFTSVLGPVE